LWDNIGDVNRVNKLENANSIVLGQVMVVCNATQPKPETCDGKDNVVR